MWLAPWQSQQHFCLEGTQHHSKMGECELLQEFLVKNIQDVKAWSDMKNCSAFGLEI